MRNGFVVLSRSLQDSYANSGLSYEAYSFYLSLFPLANHITYRVTLSQTDIASELQIYKSRVSRYLSELLLEGWVAYAPVQRSRRVKPIQLLLGWWDEEKKQLALMSPSVPSPIQNRTESYPQSIHNPESVDTSRSQELSTIAQTAEPASRKACTPVSYDSPTSVLSEGSDLGHRQDTGETQVGHVIVETPATVDVERSASLKHVNRENNTRDQGISPSHLLIPLEEGKEGNDKEGDEADVIDMGEEWRRKYASMQGDDEHLSLDEQALLIWDETFVKDPLWSELTDDDKQDLIVSFKEDN